MAKKRRRKSSSSEDTQQEPQLPVTPDVIEAVESWADEAAIAAGLVLFEVKMNAHWLIRIYVDRPGAIKPGEGVQVSECVQVSRAVEERLDDDDRVPEKYTIEVSSPGVERALVSWRQCEIVAGRTVKLVLKTPIDGQDVIEGELSRAENQILTINSKQGPVEVEYGNVSKARLTFKF